MQPGFRIGPHDDRSGLEKSEGKMEKWQSWEVENWRFEEEQRRDIRRIKLSWIASGIAVFLSFGFVAWVYSLV